MTTPGISKPRMLFHDTTVSIVTPSCTVSTSLASPQPINTTITMLATSIGLLNPQYQFWIYNATAIPAWMQLQGYSSVRNLHLDTGDGRQLPVFRHRAG